MNFFYALQNAIPKEQEIDVEHKCCVQRTKSKKKVILTPDRQRHSISLGSLSRPVDIKDPALEPRNLTFCLVFAFRLLRFKP